jgi:diacylglycerol kinase family enzyme
MGTDQLRLHVVINSEGGTARSLGAEILRQRLRDAFTSAGALAEVELVPGAELLPALERARDRAARGELDGVVVGGGDGSVNGAAGLLAGTGIGTVRNSVCGP